MITLPAIPAVVLSRDPLPLTLSSNNYKTADAVKAAAYVGLTSFPLLGDKLNVTFLGNKYTLTCTTTTNDDGVSFRVTNGTETLDEYVDNVLVPALQSNYNLAQYWHIYPASVANRFYFTAIDARLMADFEFTWSVSNFFYVYNKTLGQDAAYRDNFKINYQIIKFENGLPVAVSPVESLEPNADGSITIDPNEYLQGLVANSFDLYYSRFCKKLSSTDVLKLAIRCWESYNIDPVLNRKVYQSNTFHIIEAASARIDQARLNENNLWWYNAQLTNKYFLTKMPAERNILPGQRVFLKYLHVDGAVGLSLRVQSYTNGVLTDDKFLASLNNPGADPEVYQFEVSPEALTLSAGITSYQVYLTNSMGNALTEIRTFTLDKSYYKNVRFFFFRNALGGFDTIQAMGSGQWEEEYTRQRATKELPAKFLITDRETEVIDVSQELTFKANLGFLNYLGEGRERWANACRQFYSTKEAYEIINNELYPIDLKTNKQLLFDDENFLPDFFTIEYTRAYIEKGAPSNVPQLEGAYSTQYSPQYAGGAES